MKLAALLIFPSALAFSPTSLPKVHRTALGSNKVSDKVDEFCGKVTSTTDDVLGQADDRLLKPVLRIIDHAPILVTLKCLTSKAGMSVSKTAINAAPSSFSGLTTALAVPAWTYNVWAVIVVAQLASVAKSALSNDSNELSQADITSVTLANVFAARAITASCPLLDTGLAAVASGYALRKLGRGGEPTIHNLSMQLMSSFTTVLTVLGVISACTTRLALCEKCASVLGTAALYIMATRSGNTTVKKAVQGGILGGILYSRLAAGISYSLELPAVVNGLTTVGIGYVAYEALNRLRKAVMG